MSEFNEEGSKMNSFSKMKISIVITLLMFLFHSKLEFISVKFKKKGNQNGDYEDPIDIFCAIK